MNLFLLLSVSIVAFVIGYRFYGLSIGRWLRINDAEPTPAVEKQDRRDYVPTKVHVVFAHHFATIAGAGPIIGPVLAITYGFAPAWLWVVLGGVFFGAVHDFTALFVSIKEGGRSIADVTRRTLGRGGFVLFVLFTLLMLLLVAAAFLNITATTLASLYPIERLGLDSSQQILRTVSKPETGEVQGVIGGIASMSVIIITLIAPLIGYLIYKRGLKTPLAYLLAGTVAIGSILVGFRYPVSIDPQYWRLIISVYVLIAAGLPVWFILQPRDFTNVQILYVGMIMLVGGLVMLGIKGNSILYPMLSVEKGTAQLGLIWPMLFITVACGAISGFHALVGGGTTCKQLERQSFSRGVGYGAMLLESVLAVLVLLALAGNLQQGEYISIVFPAEGASNPILAFALAVGNMLHSAVGIPIYVGSIIGILMVEGFVITSLDSCIRFIRYLLEEMWQELLPRVPTVMRNPWFNSTLAVLGMWGLAAGNKFLALWPIFGSANQLMAALTLITISMWLAIRGLRNWFTVAPALFMTVTTVASLIYKLITDYLPKGNWTLIITDIVLLVLAAALAILAIGKARDLIKGGPRPAVA